MATTFFSFIFIFPFWPFGWKQFWADGKKESHSTFCFHLRTFLYFLIWFTFSALIILQKSLWGTLEIKVKQHQKSGNLMTKNSHQKKLFSSLWWDDDFTFPLNFIPLVSWWYSAFTQHRALSFIPAPLLVSIILGDFRFEKANIFKVKPN